MRLRNISSIFSGPEIPLMYQLPAMQGDALDASAALPPAPATGRQAQLFLPHFCWQFLHSLAIVELFQPKGCDKKRMLG